MNPDIVACTVGPVGMDYQSNRVPGCEREEWSVPGTATFNTSCANIWFASTYASHKRESNFSDPVMEYS
jgi:hypothetical protein